ncbi:VOC family protein [Lutispora saccharofermentans]|uniref:VOC family protein n=1 Tax=Lutispora saccharofermentans TaxID=3024236 RepID=A0ABT1NE10_9FIRM|nr:VOC family protein [Lutispora saccharofermentans]MCQ1529487.1 VOC family protein [Lutispora saccharofermentans]
MKVRSLSHAGLTVSSFEKAVKWYHESFGCWLISEQTLPREQVKELRELYGVEDASVRLGFLRFPKGGVIEIFEFTPLLPVEKMRWNKPGPTHITLDVKNVPKWYEHLKDKGVYFFSPPQDTDGNKWVFMKDPDGNLIELIDLKFNYPAIRILGSLIGKIMAGGKFKKYYTE